MLSVKWNKFFKGIRFRLTVVYSTLFGLFICIFAYILTTQYFEAGRKDFDARLINYAIDLTNHMIIDPVNLDIKVRVPENEMKKAFPFILKETFYSIRTIDGNMVLKNFLESEFFQLPYDPSLALRQDYTHRLLSLKIGETHYRMINMKFTLNNGEALIIQVATIYDKMVERENSHLLFLSLIIPALIIISSFFSFLIAGNALDPIRSLIDSANQIAAQNLSLRVPIVDTGDEVEELSKTLNSLLKRLEESFIAQENFVSNASHQLNTPLAIIKGELDVLESKHRSSEEINKFHQSLREELGRLIELVKNMLLISRVKSGLATFIFHPLRLDDLLLTTSSRLRTKAKEKRITVRFNIDESLSSKDLEVMGEKQLLDAVFENLLDNAIKYSPEESTIQLDIKMVDGKTSVIIEDEGPGMGEDDFRQLVSNRFQRGFGHIPGTGIGLSIAGKIATLHNATIQYKKIRPKGSLFIVKFS
jgi:signal transduction histidine kinase